MALIFEKPGLLTTVQDGGRFGFRDIGVGLSGPMDRRSAALINTLLGNDRNAAVLEMHFPAPVIRFQRAAHIALGGADLSAELDGVPIDNWRSHDAKAGARLIFGGKRAGERAYLAVAGGFRSAAWLGSRSTNTAADLGTGVPRAIETGQTIEIGGSNPWPSRGGVFISHSMVPKLTASPVVRFFEGPEYEWLDTRERERLESSDFVISRDSNRMGYRLESPVPFAGHETILSSAVTFGTVQLLPSGSLIVLMADHQTSGGYPRIATVASVDLPLLAQSGLGAKVKFTKISIGEAEYLRAERETELRWLSHGVKLAR